jgi:hypothetical protein
MKIIQNIKAWKESYEDRSLANLIAEVIDEGKAHLTGFDGEVYECFGDEACSLKMLPGVLSELRDKGYAVAC